MNFSVNSSGVIAIGVFLCQKGDVSFLRCNVAIMIGALLFTQSAVCHATGISTVVLSRQQQNFIQRPRMYHRSLISYGIISMTRCSSVSEKVLPQQTIAVSYMMNFFYISINYAGGLLPQGSQQYCYILSR